MKKKTHKWTAKRFKVSATGKLMHDKAWRSHLRIKKWNNLRADGYGKQIHKTEYRKMKALLPYTA